MARAMSKPTARVASTHYCVDETGIYETLDPKLTAWHVVPSNVYPGASEHVQSTRAFYGVLNNMNTIAVDMCCGPGLVVSDETHMLAADLVAHLIDRFSTQDAALVVARHYDIVGKRCPADMSPGHDYRSRHCSEFRARVDAALTKGRCVFTF
jgi:N-acetylmuramoyl-L-alanine amidase CwlA